MKPSKRLLISLLLGVAAFGGGLFSGYRWGSAGGALEAVASATGTALTVAQIHSIRQNSINPGEYRFINPLMICEVSEKKEIAEFAPLKQKLTSLIDTEIYNQRA